MTWIKFFTFDFSYHEEIIIALKLIKQLSIPILHSYVEWIDKDIPQFGELDGGIKYFAVAQLGQDQIEDYAKRKKITRETAEQWLMPNLGYDIE